MDSSARQRWPLCMLPRPNTKVMPQSPESTTMAPKGAKREVTWAQAVNHPEWPAELGMDVPDDQRGAGSDSSRFHDGSMRQSTR